MAKRIQIKYIGDLIELDLHRNGIDLVSKDLSGSYCRVVQLWCWVVTLVVFARPFAYLFGVTDSPL